MIHLGGVRLLFDAGDGLSSSYKATGCGYDAVDRVFLSHMHSDHVGGFSLFVQGLWLEKRRRGLPVHLPGLAVPAIQAWLRATVLFDQLLGFPLYWEPLAKNVPIREGGVTIVPFPTTHLESLRKAFQKRQPSTCFEAFCFVIEGHGKRLAYTADIGHVDDLDPLLAQPLDLLVCEASHVPLNELLAKLAGRSIGRLVFTHLERELWNNPELFQAAAQAALGDLPFVIARDGDVFTF